MPIISGNQRIAQNPFYSLGGEHEKTVRISQRLDAGKPCA